MMIGTFWKTFKQVKDPAILKALFWSTLLTMAVILLSIGLGFTFLETIMDIFSETLKEWFGKGESWFRGVVQFLGAFLLIIFFYFLFAGIHGAFVGIFIDDILDAIQEHHYPDITWAKAPSTLKSCLLGMRILVSTLLLNILAFPILVIGWFIPPVGLTFHVILNGYLLGKEYGQLIEFRIPNDSSNHKKVSYFSNGVIASIIWLIPVLNLLAPILLAGSVLHSRLNQKKLTE